MRALALDEARGLVVTFAGSGAPLGDKLYGDIWRAARQAVLTPAEAASRSPGVRMTSGTRPFRP